MKNNAHDFSEEVRALIGKVTTGLLSKGDIVTPESLIQALYRLSEHAGHDDTRPDCLELIQYLMKKNALSYRVRAGFFRPIRISRHVRSTSSLTTSVVASISLIR